MKDYKYAVRLNRTTTKPIDFSSRDSLRASGESFTILKFSPTFEAVQYKRKNQYQFGKYHEPHWVCYSKPSVPKTKCPTKADAISHFGGIKWVDTEWKRKPEFTESEVREKAFNKVTHMTGAWFRWLNISGDKVTKHTVKEGETVIENKNSLSTYEEYPDARLFFKTDDEFKSWLGEDNYKDIFVSLI